MREGIPLRVVVIGSVIAAIAVTAGTLGYFAWLRAHVLQDRPIAVPSTASVPDDIRRSYRDLKEGRTTGGEASLDEPSLNFIVFGPDARRLQGREATLWLSLDAPFARLRMSEREGERWLNADLIVQPYASERGLALKILSGTVGDVSVSSTGGEWVRMKIEKQLEHDFTATPHTAQVFAGLRDARVTTNGLVLSFKKP